jgi:large subunit ribosomal protein L15
MKLDNLRPAGGSVKNNKRLGRGQGSGSGGTASRGHKGDKARSGFKNKRHFEGGQTPMQRRLPKRGFTNINRLEYLPINLSAIQELASKGVTEITLEALIVAGLAKKTDQVKVLGKGKLTSKVDIKVHAISETAKSAVESNGGSVQIV